MKRSQAEANKQIESMTHQLAALNDLGKLVASTLDLDLVLLRILEAVRPLLQAEGVFILLLEGDNLRFVAADEIGIGNLTNVLVSTDAGVAGEVLRTRQAQRLTGAEAARRINKKIVELTDYTPRAFLAAPMHLEDDIIGVMEAVHSREDAFTKDDLLLLQAAAPWAAIAIANARLHGRIRRAQVQLEKLSGGLIEAQEEERRRIAQALHDDAGQMLTALKMILGMVQAQIEQEETKKQLAEAEKISETTMARLRRLAHDLRPPALHKMGLKDALASLCREVVAQTQLQIDFTGERVPENLPDGVQLAFYRFLQEALTNTVKHADAGKVEVTLTVSQSAITLRVADDGCGFTLPDENEWEQAATGFGLGLLGMSERFRRLGGSLDMETAVDNGTMLEATVPL